jgi:hypothetical protein
METLQLLAVCAFAFLLLFGAAIRLMARFDRDHGR